MGAERFLCRAGAGPRRPPSLVAFPKRARSSLRCRTFPHPQEYKEPEDPSVAEEGWRLMVAASGKLTVLQQMLPRLLADGHRVLIFSQSVEVRSFSLLPVCPC